VGERYLDTVEVTGSIPVSPTRCGAGQRPVSRVSSPVALLLALRSVGSTRVAEWQIRRQVRTLATPGSPIPGGLLFPVGGG
jgi:hypothetical protein